MDVRAVTATTINTSGTMYGKAIVTVSRALVDQGSTTTGIGVSSVYDKYRTLPCEDRSNIRSTVTFPKTLFSVFLEMWCSAVYHN